MNKYTLIALSLCGGFLSSLAWSGWCPGIILLASFVPFFIIEEHLYVNRIRYPSGSCFTYLLPGFTIFSMLTLGWIRAVSLTAAVCVILIAACLMAFIFWLGHLVKRKSAPVQGTLSLVVFWLALEFICLRFNIISPWINLGNGLSKDISIIQWYEVTGVGGGTLWILLSNVFLTRLIVMRSSGKRKILKYLLIWLAIVVLPATISLIRFYTIKVSPGLATETVIVQPDFDPFNEKFTIPFDQQLEKALSIAKSAASPSTRWIVAPETLVDDPVNENQMTDDRYIRRIKDFVREYPETSFMAGMVSYMPDSLKASGKDLFNSAFRIDTGSVIEIYHKSKLVPGFEFVPSGNIMKLITRLLPNLGAGNRNYGSQSSRNCFSSTDGSQKVAPVICYESVYGEYVTDYIKRGAGAIFVITNDGWWKNTNGYKHHFFYSSLRAIETRRPLIRSANTGISGFIDLRGRAVQKSEWWKAAVLKGSFVPENRITAYVRFGDVIMRIAAIISLLIIITIFIARPLKKMIE
ncbi:MAG: apolipoprotein N-acyltransferase [Bacteroidota bacterium]|nr:apolipoprotein N-acyltransferase [Bacteroidota bacterium]